jgi:hypothetical protein
VRLPSARTKDWRNYPDVPIGDFSNMPSAGPQSATLKLRSVTMAPPELTSAAHNDPIWMARTFTSYQPRSAHNGSVRWIGPPLGPRSVTDPRR